jgi:ethanolamine utilization protein EutP (predicted NTPase)
MKTQKKLILSCILIIIGLTGIAQSTRVSKWLIDKNTLFTCQNINYSEKSDTVIFQNNVNFNSVFVQIKDAEKILFNKKTKKLTILSPKKGMMEMNDKKNGMKLISKISLINEDDWKKVKCIEYTIGEHAVYVK